jgi:hypothetical protein
VRGCLIALVLLTGIMVAVPTSNVYASSLGHPTSTSGSVGIRLIADAKSSDHSPLALAYVVARLAPGATINRSVEVDNDTKKTVNASVYPAGARLARGSFDFAPGHQANELSSWTSVRDAQLHLTPGAEALDTLTIKVPKDASSGPRYGVVWAEVSARPARGGDVTLVNRVGIRMYLSIGPGGAPRSNFAIGSLAAKRSPTGAALVVSTVHNGGGSTLDLGGTLALSHGPDGLRAGPMVATLGTVLAPGSSEPVTVRLTSGLPRGPWQVDLSLASGSLMRSATATLTFPRNERAIKQSKPSSSPNFLVIVIVFLLLGISLAFVVRRRRSVRA